VMIFSGKNIYIAVITEWIVTQYGPASKSAI
jgi:hypothetical protein